MAMKLEANTMSCRFRGMLGEKLEETVRMAGWTPVDLDGNGLDDGGDGLVPIMEERRVVCGNITEKGFALEVAGKFGTQNSEKTANGFMASGAFWRATAEVDLKNNTTATSYSYVNPMLLSKESARVKAPKLGKSLGVGDVVVMAPFKNDWFVVSFDVSLDSVKFDGEKVTVDPSKLLITVANEEGMNKIKAGQKPGDSDKRTVTVDKISEIKASPAKADVAAPKPKG